MHKLCLLNISGPIHLGPHPYHLPESIAESGKAFIADLIGDLVDGHGCGGEQLEGFHDAQGLEVLGI